MHTSNPISSAERQRRKFKYKSKRPAREHLWIALDKITQEFQSTYRTLHHDKVRDKKFELDIPRPISERLNVILTLLKLQIALEKYNQKENQYE